MLVGFDLSQSAHQGGVSVYTTKLAEELVKFRELEMIFFYSSLRKPYKGRLPNVKKFRLPPTLFEVLFNKIRNVYIERFIGPVDVFHSSDWVQPPSKAKKVTTYHDLTPLLYPQWSHPRIVAVNKRRLKIVEKEIDMIIAVSEATKKDLLKVSNIPKEKIIVIYEGVDHQLFYPREKREIEEFRQKYKLPKEFILSIGGVGERRNIRRIKEVTKDFNLVITGENIPGLTDTEMPLLYNCATILLYPSLYEGFGLPIIEAMACGIPVITSDVSSMPEVGGEAALYVSPDDTEEIKKAVIEVMNDINLRNKLIGKGMKQAKLFSWEETAKKTAAVYKRICDV